MSKKFLDDITFFYLCIVKCMFYTYVDRHLKTCKEEMNKQEGKVNKLERE